MRINYSIGRCGPCNLLRVRSHRKGLAAAALADTSLAPRWRVSACAGQLLRLVGNQEQAAREKCNGRRRTNWETKNRHLACSQKAAWGRRARAWEKRCQLNRILLISTRPVSYTKAFCLRRAALLDESRIQIISLAGESWNFDGNWN